MIRSLLTLLVILSAAPAGAQTLDGTWLMFKDPADPLLAGLETGSARLPAEEIAAQRRIVIDGNAATVHAGEATISMTLALEEAEWGADAHVSGLQGTNAPITFLRIELSSPGRGTLTSYTGQIPVESFAVIRVAPQG